MADLGAYFGNPNLQRQGARARALAAQRDVNTLADPRTYAAVQGLLGTAPDQMGFSVLHPDYQNIKKVAEPAFALGLLGQAAPVLAPLTKGLPVGASIKNVGKVDALTGLPLNSDGTVTVYHHTSKKAAEQITSSKKLKSAGEPDVYVTTEKEPNTGYGETVVPVRINPEKLILDDEFPSGRMDFRIPSGKSGVPIKLEPKVAPQQEALDTAQRNAALPIEEGGLGLPKDNTPMDRAKAMGFDIDTFMYHGSDKDIYSFDPAKFGKNDQGWYGRGVTTDTDPEIASAYANYNEAENGQVVYPLLTRGKYMDWPEGQQPFASVKDSIQGTKDIQNLGYQGTRMTNDRDLYGDIPNIGTEQVTFNPANVRSRFAAFDPMRRNEADILAGVLPLGLLTDEDQRKKLYELMPSLLGQ